MFRGYILVVSDFLDDGFGGDFFLKISVMKRVVGCLEVCGGGVRI